MILRTDSFRMAGWKRAALVGGRTDVAQSIIDDPMPAARPGDVWIVRAVIAPEGETESGTWTSFAEDDGPIVGYGLTCPNTACRSGVHDWTWANNCSQRLADQSGPRCVHMRDRRSCWEWSGSVEDNTLTASPSLHSPTELGGCGWHGFLRNGEMVA